jgi:hypothetical protein
MKGLGADTSIIMEVLCSQESSEILKIAQVYKTVTDWGSNDLKEDLQKEFNGPGKKETQLLFTNLAAGSRPGPGPVDHEKVQCSLSPARARALSLSLFLSLSLSLSRPHR